MTTLSLQDQDQDRDSIIFTYIPLNHINSDGSFTCSSPQNDCESSRYDSCLVNQFCWPHCSGKAAITITSYLKCFEGPYANTEALTDPKRRKPCMLEAGYTPDEYDEILACTKNSSMYYPIEVAINASRAPMYKAIQPNPGYFPHIFINGNHQFNDSWTSLLRTLCKNLRGNLGSNTACNVLNNVTLTFNVPFTSSMNEHSIQTHSSEFAAAANDGLNLGTSQVNLPINWNTATSPSDPPSYVNVRASSSARLISATKEGSLNIRVKLELVNVLSTFMNEMKVGCNQKNGNVSNYINYALSATKLFGNVMNVSETSLHF